MFFRRGWLVIRSVSAHRGRLVREPLSEASGSSGASEPNLSQARHRAGLSSLRTSFCVLLSRSRKPRVGAAAASLSIPSGMRKILAPALLPTRFDRSAAKPGDQQAGKGLSQLRRFSGDGACPAILAGARRGLTSLAQCLCD